MEFALVSTTLIYGKIMGNYKPSIKQYVVTAKAIKSSQFARLGICAIVLLFILGYPFYFISNNPFDTSIRFQYVDPYNDTTRKYTTIEKQHTDIGGNSTTIIYPKNLDLDLDQAALQQVLNTTNTTNPFVQYIGNSSSIAFSQLNQTLATHNIQVFDSSSNSKNCLDILTETRLTISQNIIIKELFEIMIKRLIHQLNTEPAFKELAPFFQNRLSLHLRWKTYHKHFYKFAGTSVWLKDYGVHLMISRVIYSQKAKKGDPQISLLYAQLYDTNWQELTNTDLLVSMQDTTGAYKLETLLFPRFLPMPFYFNPLLTKGRWYGPEDARIMLVKNQLDIEEPMIIFNSYHRQITNHTTTETKDGSVELNFEFYRSMFVGWPFRYQLGKANTDGFVDDRFDNVKFTRVAELKIHNQTRAAVEKNWTPFVDPSERNPEDKSLYIVYQWDKLRILKCDISNLVTDDGFTHYSACKFKQDSKLKKVEKVGPIRGGTELIPTTIDNKRLWIGFLRAHIDKCGCGKAMYRPNMVVLQKTDKGTFKVAYLSSYISFNIPVPGWKTPDIQCAKKDPSVLIPNGISNWEVATIDGIERDVLTMTLSAADEDNILMDIHGLKTVIQDLITNQKQDNELDTDLVQMKCVVAYSTEFCRAYGEEQARLGLTGGWLPQHI